MQSLKINYSFVPELKCNKLYLGYGIEKKKKDLFLEISSLNIHFVQSSFFQNYLLENRLWLYEDIQNIEDSSYVSNFRLTDLSAATYLFDFRRTKSSSLYSLIFLYNVKKYFLHYLKTQPLLKTRMVLVNKKGYKFSLYNKLSNFQRPFFYQNTKKPFSYSLWYLFNLNFLGFLNVFSLKDWQIKKVSRLKYPLSSPFLKKYRLYYKKNSFLKSFITLKK
jgi:hypothetical protein